MAKRIMRAFKIDEISGVDRPAQEGARVTIMKRNAAPKPVTEEFVKDLYGVMSSSGNPPGARSFSDLIAATEACRRQSEVSQELWPYFDALTDSLRSIVADASLDEATKINTMRQSIDQFTEAVLAAVPEAEAEIAKLFTDPAQSGVFLAGNQAGDPVSKGDNQMSDDTKKVADLEKAVSDLTKANTDLTKAKDDAEAKVADLTKSADIAKNDEVLKVGDTEVRKSAVGEASFAFMKAQQAEIEKANDKADMAELQKRAESELGQLPGDAIAKAKVLKAIAKMSDEDKGVLDTMLKAGQAAIAKGFTKFGVLSGGLDADNPAGKLDALAKAKAEKDGITFAKAYDAVLKTEEGTRLYAESRSAA